MKQLYLSIGLLTFYALCGNAQPPQGNDVPSGMPQNGMITGKVHDERTGQPIEYATLSLHRQHDSSLVTGTITDSHGAFSLKGLPYGLYYLEAGFLGYEKLRINRIVITSQKPFVEAGLLKLMPAAVDIDAVEVVAGNNRIEYKIDKKVVTLSQDLTSSGGMVSQALENTPSIEVDVEGNVTLRGSSNFKVLIDGKPSVIEGSEALQQIPSSSVQSVEIITNPSAKYDPDGAAGIINLVMKKEKQQGVNGVVNASLGTRNKYSADFLLNMRKEKTNFFLGGDYSNNDFHMEGNSDQRRYYQGDTTITLADREGVFKRNGFSIKAGADYYVNDKTTVTLQGSIGNRTFERNFSSRYQESAKIADTTFYYTEDNLAPHDNQYYNIGLDYRKIFDNPLHELKAALYFSQAVEKENQEIIKQETGSDWIPIEQNQLLNRSREETPEKNFRAQVDYVYPVNENTKLEAGFQSRWDMDHGEYILENYDPDRREWIYDSTLSNTLDYLDAIQSLYGTFSGKFGKFGYQAGLRAEYDNRTINQITLDEAYRYEKMHFFPSFYITRELPKEMQLQLSYSRRIERPDEWDLNPFKEYMDHQNIRMGNPELSPEFTNAFELNYQYPFKKNFISFETFYRQTSNAISRYVSYDSTSGIFTHTSRNADEEYSAGAELMANLTLTKWLSLNLTGNVFRYSLTGETDEGFVTRTTTSWGTNGNMVMRLKGDTRVQLTGMYRGPSVTLQGEREGFFFLNLAVRKDFLNKKLNVILSGRDILKSSKHAFTSEGTGFYTHQEFRREAPVVTLTLTYRINNYKQKQNGNGSDEGRDVDFEGGM